MFSLIATFAAAITSAEAGILEPQVRLHAGVNYVLGPAPFGVTGGLDARLTRILAIDMGGFGTFSELTESDYVDQAADNDYFLLRHGVYFAPGLRVPHPQPRTWAWDVFVRGGAGVVWYADTDPSVLNGNNGLGHTTAAAAGFGGLDLLFRVDRYGARATGRAWIYEAQHQIGGNPAVLVQPQITLEGFVEF